MLFGYIHEKVYENIIQHDVHFAQYSLFHKNDIFELLETLTFTYPLRHCSHAKWPSFGSIEGILYFAACFAINSGPMFVQLDQGNANAR